MRNDRLPGSHLDHAFFVAHVQASAQDQREFFEFGSLSGFFPTGRTAHVGHANAAFPAVQPADIFVNDLGKIPGRLYARGFFNECGQKNSLKLVLNRLRLKDFTAVDALPACWEYSSFDIRQEAEREKHRACPLLYC